MTSQLDDLFASMRDDPEFQAYRRRIRRAERLTAWMKHLPLGSLLYVFWNGLLTEGLRDTCKPRWGALTFCFLNDGQRPTAWHTWRSIHHGNFCEFAGIYPSGAPRSFEQAIEWKTRDAA